jgi:hypothetical protein
LKTCITAKIDLKQYMLICLDHKRPNLRMNDQVLRVFNGFYKQIYGHSKLDFSFPSSARVS